MKLRINAQEKTIKVSNLFDDCTKDWTLIAEELVGYADDNKDFAFVIDKDSCLGTKSFAKLFDGTTNIIAEDPNFKVQFEFDAAQFYKSVTSTDSAEHGNHLCAVKALNKNINKLSGGRYTKVENISKNRGLFALYDENGICDVVEVLAKNGHYFYTACGHDAEDDYEYDKDEISPKLVKLAFDVDGEKDVLIFYSVGAWPIELTLFGSKSGKYEFDLEEMTNANSASYRCSTWNRPIDKGVFEAEVASDFVEIEEFDGHDLRIKVDREWLFDKIRGGEGTIRLQCLESYEYGDDAFIGWEARI